MINFKPIYSDSFISGEKYHYLRYCDRYLSLLSSNNSRFKLIYYDQNQAILVRKTEENLPGSRSLLKTVGKILVFLSYFSLVLPALAGLGSWYYRQKNRFMEQEDLVQLQSMIRAQLAKMELAQQANQKKLEKVIKCQSIVRRKLAQQAYQKMRAAALTFQASFIERKFKETRRQIIKCQSIVRRKLAQQAYQRTRAGALAIQAACRRIDYQKMRSAALTFQALFIERRFKEILPQLKETRQRAAAIYQKDIHSNRDLLRLIASFLPCSRDQLSLSSVDKKAREFLKSLFQNIVKQFLEKKFNGQIPYEPGVTTEKTLQMALEMGIYNQNLIDAFGGLSKLYALPVYHFKEDTSKILGHRIKEGTPKTVEHGISFLSLERLPSPMPIMRGREDHLCKPGDLLNDPTHSHLRGKPVKSLYQSRPFILIHYNYKYREKKGTVIECIYPSLNKRKWTNHSNKRALNSIDLSQISLSHILNTDIKDVSFLDAHFGYDSGILGYQRLKSLIYHQWIFPVPDELFSYTTDEIIRQTANPRNRDEYGYVELVEEGYTEDLIETISAIRLQSIIRTRLAQQDYQKKLITKNSTVYSNLPNHLSEFLGQFFGNE